MVFICTECEQNAAEEFCICAYPVPNLCDSGTCRERHRVKPGVHEPFLNQFMVNTWDEWIQIKRDVEDIYHKSEEMCKRLGNEIDVLIHEVHANTDELISCLNQRKDSLISKLSEVREEIKQEIIQAKRRVLNSMLMPDYHPLHRIDSNIMPRSTEVMQIFKGKVSEDLDLIPQLLTLTLSSDLIKSPSYLLADIKEASLQIFDCKTESFDPPVALSNPIKIDKSSVSVFLPDFSLLCTGGGRLNRASWASVHHIETDGTVQSFENMNWTRDSHGLIVVQGHVYAFGGYALSRQCVLGTAERLSIEPLNNRRRWSSLPDMLTPRYAFNPCAVERTIFLCGAGSKKRSEKFDIESFAYTALNFLLPEDRECLVLEDQGKLIILTENYVSVSDTTESRALVSRNHIHWPTAWASMNPVKWGQNVYFPYYGAMHRVDLTSLVRSEVPKHLA